MSKFIEARQRITSNERVMERYQHMLKGAEEYYAKMYVPIDDLTLRQIGVIDWYRGKYPERVMTDEETLAFIDELNRKYEEENNE